jgi:hypothetical protein
MRGNPWNVPGDPHRITTRRAGECAGCGVEIPAGVRAFYWPKGKRLECLNASGCGEAAERRFVADVEDEIASGGWS